MQISPANFPLLISDTLVEMFPEGLTSICMHLVGSWSSMESTPTVDDTSFFPFDGVFGACDLFLAGSRRFTPPV